ncbi:MAG: hypothetical protein JXP34_16090 [Planctomycetes bacterium]|nr:hypothetical protein [Planctomycetota bacterium]
MAQKKRRDYDPEWARAKRLCRLNVEDVRMAKELGFRPKNLIRNIPSKSQRWKAPVKVWIRQLYEERRKKRPGDGDRGSGGGGSSAVVGAAPEEGAFFPEAGEPCSRGDGEPFEETCEDAFDGFDVFDDDVEPTERDIDEDNEDLLRRRREFRLAAEYVAGGLAEIPSVEKVVLFGSVAAPLEEGIPRFRRYHRHRIPLWHECKDVDLAVWVRDLGVLRAMQKARKRALDRLLAERNIGVAHHQVDVFILDPASDAYLGRLCWFKACPKEKPECSAPDCGKIKLLRQHRSFRFDPEALEPGRSVILWERGSREDDDVPF